MLREAPFTGIGLNAYREVNDYYVLLPDGTPHAHNTYLQTGLEVGVLGLVAFLALMGLFFVLAARAYRRARDPNARAALLGLAGCGAAYLGYGLADSLWIGRQGALPLWLMLGIVAGAGRGLTPIVSRRAAWVLIALLTPLALVGTPVWSSVLLTNAGVLVARPPWAGPAPSIDQLDRTEALARWALQLWEGNSRAHALLGEIAWLRGDDDLALTAYGRAAELDPAEPLAHYRLGELYAGQSDQALAVTHYRAAGAGGVLLGRAYEARSREDWPEAVRWYGLAEAVSPGDERALRGLASALRASGDPAAAELRWRDYTARFPELPWGYAGVGDLLLLRDQAPAAVQVYQEGLAAAGPEATLYLGLARAQQRAGDNEAAIDAALAGLALRPDLRGGWHHLGGLYEAQGRPEEALAAYLRAVGETEDHTAWASLMGAGRILLRDGSPAEAAAHLERAATISGAIGERPEVVARVYTLLGDALAAAGRPEAAAQAYRQALALDPENPAAPEGLARLGDGP
jgi:tetratricopeptide (TPR) repeat protein